MPPKRGQCTVCRYRYPLRKDGTIQGHHGFHGRDPAPECEGSRTPPVPFDPDLCPACMEHRFSTPGLVEACFSVAVESARSGEALMWDYFAAYHENGHREAA